MSSLEMENEKEIIVSNQKKVIPPLKSPNYRQCRTRTRSKTKCLTLRFRTLAWFDCGPPHYSTNRSARFELTEFLKYELCWRNTGLQVGVLIYLLATWFMSSLAVFEYVMGSKWWRLMVPKLNRLFFDCVYLVLIPWLKRNVDINFN